MIGSKPIRALQVVAAPSGDGPIGVNGPERRALRLVDRWASLGIEPCIVYPRRGRLWDDFERAGFRPIDFEIGSKLRFDRVFALASIARENGVDVIHSQGPGSLDGFACVAARLAGAAAIITRPVMMEDHVHLSPLRRRIYAGIDRLTIRLADRVVAVSDAGRRHLSDVTGVPESRIELVYNGVDLVHYQPSSAPTQRRPIRIGMAAQLTPPKGWLDYLSVAEKLGASHPDVEFQVIGDGPLRGELGERIRERNLENVRLCGHVDDVSAALRDLDVFVLTSRREGLSMAVLEAMGCGLPVVATDVGGTREQVISGENGWICPPGDVESLADRISTLLASEERRRAMGEASRRRVQAIFSEDSMAAGYAATYRAAAAAG